MTETDKHFDYLADTARIRAFMLALQASVTPDSVVVDLGSGSGVLGMLACRAGARRVYAVERSGILEPARRVARANGYEGRIIHVRGTSTGVVLPEPADILVGDPIGPVGAEAGPPGAFCDAAARFLRVGGVMIPSRVDTWVSPVQSTDADRVVSRWSQSLAGFSFNEFADCESSLLHRPSGGSLLALSRGQKLLSHRYDLTTATLAESGQATFEITSRGRLNAICCWFVAQLTSDVTMTNDPCSADRIQRRAGLCLISPPVSAEPGDVMTLSLISRPWYGVLEWKGTVYSDGGVKAHFSGSHLTGRLLSSDVRR